MTRFVRFALLATLLVTAFSVGRAPAAAVSAGCSSIADDGSLLPAGKLFVQASYAGDASTFFRFYLSGPETRTVYEGNDPGNFAKTITGLAPGTYRFMLYVRADNGDGTFGEQTETLASRCLVSGLVEVPSLAGTTKTEATSALVAKGLVLGTVSSAYSSSVAAGLVIGQTPSAGADVTIGSKVAITLSKGPAPTPTPTAKPTVRPTTPPTAVPTTGTPTEAPTTPATDAPTIAIPTDGPTTTPGAFTTPGATPGAAAPAVGETPRSGNLPGIVLLGTMLPVGVLLVLLVVRRRR